MRCKSHQPLPLDPDLAKEILHWKDEGPYPNRGPKDFVFPNLDTGKPMWQDSISIATLSLPQCGRTSARSVGTRFATAIGRGSIAPILVQRDLMRHASVQTTEDYGKETEVSDQKRE